MWMYCTEVFLIWFLELPYCSGKTADFFNKNGK